MISGGQWSVGGGDDPFRELISRGPVLGLCCCGNVGYNVSVSIEEAGPEQLRGELSQLLQDLSAALIC